MIKITTNTGKVYMVSAEDDLELIANNIFTDATSNANGFGMISVCHRTTITIDVYDDETSAEALWALLNRAGYF